MHLHKVNIGGLETPNNVFLAPLAGYTNAVFRDMCYRLGAGLTFTEMVSAKGLCYGSAGTKELLINLPEYGGIRACQLFGSEPEYLERAAKSEEIAPFELIDINMGCPVPKIFKNGEGSALLADIKLAERIVKAVKSSGKRVSVKFRTGISEGNLVTEEFARAMEGAGADMITIHGRTREKVYSGEVNYAEIERAKKAVKIPVIANGGVFSPEDAVNLMERTGADGVMLARGAMYNPFLFAEITGTPAGDKRAHIERQLDLTYKYYGDRFATVYMRKMIGFYIKGSSGAAQMRLKLLSCNSREEIEGVLSQIKL